VAEPTKDDIDALVGPATPHFAMQIRARVRALIRDEQIAFLERLAHASSKAEEGPLEPPTRLGWEELPSHAPAVAPLPPKQ